MRVAAVDLGTNSFLCLIAERNADEFIVLSDNSRVVRLGQAVDKTRQFHPEALRRAEVALAEFAQIATPYSPQKSVAVATSAARDVKEIAPLENLVRKYGFELRVLSGPEEARLSFLGSHEPAWGETNLVVDIGGGSTEFIVGTSQGIQFRQSFDIGAVRATERFLKNHPVHDDEVFALQQHLDKLFQNFTIPRIDVLNLVAGTPTTLAAMILGSGFDANRIHGSRLDMATVNKWRTRLQSLSVEERARTPGLDPKRSEVIVAGLIILEKALRMVGSDVDVRVSVRGLRYGLAKELLQS